MGSKPHSRDEEGLWGYGWRRGVLDPHIPDFTLGIQPELASILDGDLYLTGRRSSAAHSLALTARLHDLITVYADMA